MLPEEEEFEIPGLDVDAVVEGGEDPSNDNEDCEGGACKI